MFPTSTDNLQHITSEIAEDLFNTSSRHQQNKHKETWDEKIREDIAESPSGEVSRKTAENKTRLARAQSDTAVNQDNSSAGSADGISRSSAAILQEALDQFTPPVNEENTIDRYDGSSNPRLLEEENLYNNQNVFEALFGEDHKGEGSFPTGTACPYMGIRKLKKFTANSEQKEKVSCLSHQPAEKDCKRAAKEYEIHKKPLQCAQQSQKDICSIEETSRTSPESELKIRCDVSACKGHPVNVTGIHPLEGIVDKEKELHSFVTSEGLESFLAHFVIVNTLRSFNFCFLRCKVGNKKYISQILTFPPLLETENSEFLPKEKDQNLINFNIVVLDSVSRTHFYRSLPKTVHTLRNIVYKDSINATALDFELLQSSAPYTFHNIRAFMSGKSDFNYVEHSNGTYGIEVLYKKLKNLGYYTLLQEDSCWFDEWGSLFTNNVFQNKTPRSLEEFEVRWSRFQDVVSNYYIDDFGLSHTSCDVFKQYNVTNQFNRPRRICYGGKVYAEHFLDYSLSVFQGHIDSGKRQPIFAYTHLSPGHEVTGTRIRQIDDVLSGYLYSIAHEEDTMTIVFSDHGPKTTKFSFQTMEGRAEVYDSLLFAIVPQKVASILGMRRMRAMVTNQRRLLTSLDLHNAIISIGDSERSTSGSYLQEGIFAEIPSNRTCADISMKPSAVCKCENWDQRFPDNDAQFTSLAEFALGYLNNNIQENFLETPNRPGGFGRCQRLVGHSFEKIRRRKVGQNYLLTMDLVVFPEREIFEVQLSYPVGTSAERRDNFPRIANSRRVSIYRRFEKCVDEGVKVESCVCDSHNYGRELSHKNHWKWFEIQSASDVLETVFQANSFGTRSEVKDLHESCLLLVSRKRENLGVTFELANACSKRKYKVRLTGKGKGRNTVTRKFPLSIVLQPRTVHFVLSVHYLEKPFDFYLKTSFVAYTV